MQPELNLNWDSPINDNNEELIIRGNKIHTFYESLKKSDEEQKEFWWKTIYDKFFPELAAIVSIKGNCAAQKMGIDRQVTLKNGRIIKIDEKVRYKEYGDFALEYVSSDTCETPGWVEKDLPIDYLNYIVKPSRTCYLLPFDRLRLAWSRNKDKWKKEYRHISAANPGYNTLSLCVPRRVLWTSLVYAQTAKW